MGDGIKVDTADLRAKANQIDDLRIGDAGTLASHVLAPDCLASTRAAVLRLQAIADHLIANQKYGEVEGRRLAETLRLVGDAYDEFDAAARRSLDGGPTPTPVVPRNNSSPQPVLPTPLGPTDTASDTEALHVDVAQRRLSDGDGGRSLEAAKDAWDALGASLQTAATTFQAPIRNWEGDAADEVYGKFFDYGVWLTKLGQGWQQLSVEAHRLVDAHLKAAIDHTPVFQQYEALLSNMGVGNHLTTMLEMERLQHQSEEIQTVYAGSSVPQVIAVDPPPRAIGDVPRAAVTENGDPRQLPSDWADRHQLKGASASQVSGAEGGLAPAGPLAMSRTTERAAGQDDRHVPPNSESSPAAESPAERDSLSGGGPSPGGPPGGNVPTMPRRGSDDVLSDIIPGGPGLRPAATNAGAGRGTAGGSVGSSSMPLQPNVGGTSVGLSPVRGGVVGGALPGTGTVGGAASGVGGIPMQGQGQGRGKDRKRTPGLSPDEDLYVEDREYTEEVVGARKRRTLQDAKDSK